MAREHKGRVKKNRSDRHAPAASKRMRAANRPTGSAGPKTRAAGLARQLREALQQ